MGMGGDALLLRRRLHLLDPHRRYHPPPHRRNKFGSANEEAKRGHDEGPGEKPNGKLITGHCPLGPE